MTRASFRWLFSLPAISLVSMSGCTATLNETPVSDGNCSPDTTVVGCVGDSKGYSCRRIDGPDQSDASLICSVANRGACRRRDALSADVSDVACSRRTPAPRRRRARRLRRLRRRVFVTEGTRAAAPDETDSLPRMQRGDPGKRRHDALLLRRVHALGRYVRARRERSRVRGLGHRLFVFGKRSTGAGQRVARVRAGDRVRRGNALLLCHTSATPAGTARDTCAVDATSRRVPFDWLLVFGGRHAAGGQSFAGVRPGGRAAEQRPERCVLLRPRATATPRLVRQDAAVDRVRANSVGLLVQRRRTPAQSDATLTCGAGPTAGDGIDRATAVRTGRWPPPTCVRATLPSPAARGYRQATRARETRTRDEHAPLRDGDERPRWDDDVLLHAELRHRVRDLR